MTAKEHTLLDGDFWLISVLEKFLWRLPSEEGCCPDPDTVMSPKELARRNGDSPEAAETEIAG